MKLNPKQELFCLEYAKSKNATQAAIAAGYSERTAGSIGQRLLKHELVSTKINRLIGKAKQKAEVNLIELMKELKRLAFADMANFATWEKDSVSLIPSDNLKPELLKAVESISESRDRAGLPQIKIRLHSKLRAIEALLKLHELSELESRIAEIERRLDEKS